MFEKYMQRNSNRVAVNSQPSMYDIGGIDGAVSNKIALPSLSAINAVQTNTKPQQAKKLAQPAVFSKRADPTRLLANDDSDFDV